MWSTTEVVVTGQYKGPALWKVTKGDGVVWIIGVLSVTTANPQFDQKRIDTILTGAQTVYLPPEAKGRVGAMFQYLSSRRLKPGQTLRDVTAPEDYARFLALSSKYGIEPARYANDTAIWAALRFRAAVSSISGYTDSDVINAILKLAKRHKVKVEHIATYKISPLLKRISRATDAEGRHCFATTLDGIEFDARTMNRLTADWATGNLAGLKAVYAGNTAPQCMEDDDLAKDFRDRSGSDTVAMIERALGNTKRSVMILPVSVLIKGDLLDRLRAKGYLVQLPVSLRQ
ncbi:TraB/GumN family protein [Asticcacaulis sp. 201]|uniref:TraB/GumN family protein n=1 Tax=Asticcacaulis sp. 201 TaxID=3028787 RepID=UPI00291708D6|nr:TraB/GumN family protein [Asticcacaulis sp. 201]MDV6330263.1 TraB/GumN family protein [Asticcacaulis sp. 201]